MRRITLKTNTGASRIILGAPISDIRSLCDVGKTIIIADRNVAELYGEQFTGFSIIELEADERHKTLDTVSMIYKNLLPLEPDRSSFILGVGGGVACDIAGFVASTYLRGLPFAFAPTTFLAQIDASVGGKNGVNLDGYKNLIGTFNQPQFVLCDFEVLRTLPHDELKNGFAEVVKHALIGSRPLFSYIEKNLDKALLLDGETIARIVRDSLMVKIDIVSRDEMERGERRKLNFGHTFGHAFEKTAGLKHGEAISVGMLMEARVSEMKGLLKGRDVRRVQDMLERVGLPVKVEADKAAVMDAVCRDKKREGRHVHFVVLDGIGSARIEKIEISEIGGIVDDMC